MADLRYQQADEYANNLNTVITGYSSLSKKLAASAKMDFVLAKSIFEQARIMASQLSEQIFLAERALEIYELDDPAVRFDYGYIPPDQEREGGYCPSGENHSFCNDVTSLVTGLRQVIAISILTFNDLPINLQTWIGIYNLRNAAQAGCEVDSPAYSIQIPDASSNPILPEDLRQALKPTFALRFAVNLDDLGSNYYEVKVDSLQLQLLGAGTQTDQIVHFYIRHSGNYFMKRFPSGETVQLNLSGRGEVCNFRNSSNGTELSCNIPFQDPSNVEPGPPISFWGRGAATEWYLFHDDVNFPNEVYDVSNLTKAVITIATKAVGKPASSSGTQPLPPPHPMTINIPARISVAQSAAAKNIVKPPTDEYFKVFSKTPAGILCIILTLLLLLMIAFKDYEGGIPIKILVPIYIAVFVGMIVCARLGQKAAEAIIKKKSAK